MTEVGLVLIKKKKKKKCMMTVGDDDGQTDGVPVHLDRYFESGNFRGREKSHFSSISSSCYYSSILFALV